MTLKEIYDSLADLDASNGAVSYRIQRASNGYASYIIVGKPESTTVTLPGGKLSFERGVAKPFIVDHFPSLENITASDWNLAKD